MWAKVIQIILKIWNKTKGFFINKKSFIKDWNKLKPSQRDKIRNKALKDKGFIFEMNKIKNKLKQIFTKQINSTNDNDFLDTYESIFAYEKQANINQEKIYINEAKSHWIKTVKYFKQSKKVEMLIANKNGYKKWYTFFNVPYHQYLKLIINGGKYMWDYFGVHYSLNPSHWIRKMI